MAAIFRSPAHAFASVVSVLGILTHGLIAERMAALAAKVVPADETMKRAIQDLNARVATLEYGVKTRGF